MTRHVPKLRLLVAAVAAIAVAAGTYAFTAGNTVPPSRAGAGSGAVSAYVFSAFHFSLNMGTPQRIDTATFTVNPSIPSASTGKVIIMVGQSGAPSPYDCTTNATGESVTCAMDSPLVYAEDVSHVTIVAAQ
jgi:hypothetical protein